MTRMRLPPATRGLSTTPAKITSIPPSISSPSNCRRRRSVHGLGYAPPRSGGGRRTSRFSGPELALLAPAAERWRYAHLVKWEAEGLRGRRDATVRVMDQNGGGERASGAWFQDSSHRSE